MRHKLGVAGELQRCNPVGDDGVAFRSTESRDLFFAATDVVRKRLLESVRAGFALLAHKQPDVRLVAAALS